MLTERQVHTGTAPGTARASLKPLTENTKSCFSVEKRSLRVSLLAHNLLVGGLLKLLVSNHSTQFPGETPPAPRSPGRPPPAPPAWRQSPQPDRGRAGGSAAPRSPQPGRRERDGRHPRPTGSPREGRRRSPSPEGTGTHLRPAGPPLRPLSSPPPRFLRPQPAPPPCVLDFSPAAGRVEAGNEQRREAGSRLPAPRVPSSPAEPSRGTKHGASRLFPAP